MFAYGLFVLSYSGCDAQKRLHAAMLRVNSAHALLGAERRESAAGI
jgi:hypothetical protein